MKFITSRDNPIFRQLVKLKESARQRRTSGQTLLDGIHLIDAYNFALGPPQALIVSESGRENAEIKRLQAEQSIEAGSEVVVLSDALFREVSLVKTPIGVMALISIPEHILMCKGGRGESFCVLLEAIQDPG